VLCVLCVQCVVSEYVVYVCVLCVCVCVVSNLCVSEDGVVCEKWAMMTDFRITCKKMQIDLVD